MLQLKRRLKTSNIHHCLIIPMHVFLFFAMEATELTIRLSYLLLLILL